jgi:uncharacterized iron-regulated protein
MHARTHLSFGCENLCIADSKLSARNAVGAPSNALRQYFERYQREFRKVHCHLSQTELLSSLATADIFVCGDYHTLAQARRTALELADGLRQRLEASQPLIIALEMLPARFTPIAEDYLAGRLSEGFLARIGYWKNWGLPGKTAACCLNLRARMGCEWWD